MSRPFGGAGYLWMAARSRNALRRIAVMGIVGGFVFVAALIAFVLVPRQATQVAAQVTSALEERPDSTRVAAIRDRAAASIAAADSMLSKTRSVALTPPMPVVDTFPPESVAQRGALSNEIATLSRLIDRAENAPLPSSYRALAQAPSLASDAAVRALLDSLLDIERERDAFGAVGGVDPVYVALTSRATAVGRSIQEIAEARRTVARQQLALLRPAAAPRIATQAQADTATIVAQKVASQRAYVAAIRDLAQIKVTIERIDTESARARNLANVGAPPLAMLAAALVLALALGFSTSFAFELNRPTVADAREAEQVTGVRVLSVIQPEVAMAERSRRQADESGPPLIDVVSEGYRRLYLHLAATEANVPIVTVAGDDAGIVSTVASNIAAAAAYEARSTLLVDVDPVTSTIAKIFRIPSNPGLTGIISGASTWPESIVTATVGRDRTLDVLPSGTRRDARVTGPVAERIRGDFARMERRYDLIVIAAPTAYVQRGSDSIIPGPDVVLCARIAQTKISRLREAVVGLRTLDHRIHGLVLWDDDMPVIKTQDEPAEPSPSRSRSPENLAGVS